MKQHNQDTRQAMAGRQTCVVSNQFGIGSGNDFVTFRMEAEYFAVERLGVSAGWFVREAISEGADRFADLGAANGQIRRQQSAFAAGVVINRHILNLRQIA